MKQTSHQLNAAVTMNLLAAAEFALSVIIDQGMYDLSERMAAERLAMAIGQAGGDIRLLARYASALAGVAERSA